MERFKKRTIALVLASVVTVAGAFGADRYKNSLMGISFEGSSGSSVNLVVQTKTAYEGNISPIRTDAHTYVLMLPEMNSEASTPNLKKVSANIASVNIRTMPYSNNAKGYTRITIKTVNPTVNLSASNQIYVASSNEDEYILPDNSFEKQYVSVPEQFEPVIQEPVKRVEEIVKDEQPASSGSMATPETEHAGEVVQESGLIETPIVPEVPASSKSSGGNGAVAWLWALLIVLGSAFFYSHARRKMREIAGEKLDIDVNDENKKGSTRKNLSQIKNTIKTLDSSYSNHSTMPGAAEYTMPSTPVKTAKPAEELDIVDLDELFQEHKAKKASDNNEDEENDALEEFLSGFSFDESEEESVEPENQPGYDEEAYEKTINNESLKFSEEDVQCMNQLLDSEISEETIRNIEQFAVSNPIKKIPSKQKLLEEMVTNYAISQNIVFSHEDIQTLYKLMSIELDNDFITDLRTNPQRTEEMEQDILSYGDKPKKPSEIITLSVKDMLPDLSEALKKQGNRKIESNHRAEAVYYSEGYEVSKLSLSGSLPDLSAEINKKDAFASKPSAEYQYVDTSYVVGAGELKISSELPDLQDVLANPDKYAASEQKEVVVDEEALLKNISNVQFKPFDDGTNQFEVLNDFSETPSVADIQQEFKQFEGFEISEEEKIEKRDLPDDYDDFKSLYSNEYVDLDKQEYKSSRPERKESDSTQDLIQKIEAAKLEREARKARIPQKELTRKPEGTSVPAPEQTETVKCILDGEVFSVVSSAAITDNKGCYLAKNDSGYAVLGYIGEKLVKIKQFDELKSEKIHARVSDKLDDGTERYIIRIGVNKFLVSVNDDSIDYLMDL